MRIHSYLFRCIRLILLTCVSVTPDITLAATASTQSFRVVVLGSSTAAGAGANPVDSSWVNKYARYLATVFPAPEVVNLAVGGQTTFNIMPTNFSPPSPWNVSKYFPRPLQNITRALQLYPNLIIINLPSNDCVDYIPVERQVANYDRILQDADAAGVPVWITTSQPRNIDQAGRTLLQQMRSAILSRYAGRAIDFWSGLADASGFILPQFNADGTHLNNSGHQVLFERVRDAIRFQVPLIATPPAVDFGPVRLGVTSIRTVTLENSTSSAITLDEIKTAHWLFSVDRGNAVVPAYGAVDLHVSYTPGSFWYTRDTLLIHNNAGAANLQIPLTGVSPAPDIQASPLNLDFGPVAIHTSKGLTVTLSTQSLNSAKVDSVSFSGAGFSADPTSGVVTSSSPLTVSVIFTPERFGWYTDTLRIRGGFTTGGLSIPVRGNSPAPVFTLSRTQIAFPEVRTGAAAVQRVMLRNGGSNPLTVLSVGAKTRHFSILTATPAQVSAADSIAFTIEFRPDTTGEMRDTITVVTNVGLKTVDVSGTSPAQVLLTSAPVLEFGTTLPGTTIWRSVVLSLNPRNNTPSVKIDSVRVKGPGFFIDGAGGPVKLTQTDSVILRVGFSPVQRMVYRDTLYIFNSSCFSVINVALKGAAAASTAVGPTAELPERTMLLQNYPNPFNPSTTIGFRVSGSGSSWVRLSVYDLLGREVAVLVNEPTAPGTHAVDFTAGGTGLPSGVYYYCLRAGQACDVKPMLLIR